MGINTRANTLILSLSGLLWVGAIGFGFKTLWDYKTTPGSLGNVQSQWPRDSTLRRDSQRATLVMLAHPQCPCTRASVSELALLMTRLQGKVSAYVVILKPKELPDGWEKSDTWRRAERIPGVTVLSDSGGVEAARFGGETSGQTMLFAPDGRLLFNGGITPSRGHEGESSGYKEIVSLVTSGVRLTGGTSKVFGCALAGHPPVNAL